MKKTFKTFLMCFLSLNLFAQSTSLESNKVKFGNQYELTATPGSSLELRGLSSNFGPSLAFINNQTNTFRASVGSFNTPALTNTFGINSLTSITFATLDGSFYPSRLSIINNGNIGIGTEVPSTKLEVNGFTKLGSDAPAIKIKKLTTGCTTSANSGFPSGEISLTHGITPSKILKVEALVEYATNFWVKDGNDLFGYEFDVYVTNTTISLRNLSGSASSEIRSKPCKILITYEE